MTERVLLASGDTDFQVEFKKHIALLDPEAEVFSAPTAARAMGTYQALKTDRVVVDLALEGIEDIIKNLADEVHNNDGILLTYSSEEGDAGKTLAENASVDFSDADNASTLVSHMVAPPSEEEEEKPYADAQEYTQEEYAAVLPKATKWVLGEDEGDTLPPDVSPGISSLGARLPSLDELLLKLLDMGGSDLHLSIGSRPRIRVNGFLAEVEGTPRLMEDEVRMIVSSIVKGKRRDKFVKEQELDFSYSIPGKSRFRVNIFQQRGTVGAVFRTIPFGVPSIEELGLPAVCKELSERPRGLVLVTGPTGSGKSTTLAAMINYINSTKAIHIITLEDPIEFMHRNKKSLVNQREIGEDTESFQSALKRVLRQDPDVILVGELRDFETISAAITAAETGHLVFGTLHTTGGPETVDRIIDVFPPTQQNQVRIQLAGSLQGVLSQVLCPKADGRGRVLAMEVMIGVPAISNLIREGKTHQMQSIIQSGGAQGMITLDQSLKKLANERKITNRTAIEKAHNPRDMADQLGVVY